MRLPAGGTYALGVKTALITGARGFIGRHLAKYLSSEGVRVLGLGHGSWTEDDCQAFGVSRWINGDVTQQNLALLTRGERNPDCVFHLAGGSSVGPSMSAPEEDFCRTVMSTMELLEWVRTASNATAVVFASSAAVYGTGYSGPIASGSPTRPTSPYGTHKRIAEELCLSHGRSFGVRCAIVRLFSVYGPGLRKQLLWDVCGRLARECKVLELGGTGREQRDFLHVSDSSKFLLAAAHEAAASCPVFNAGTGQAVSVCDVAELLVQLWPSNARIEFSGVARGGDPESLVADLGTQPHLVSARLHPWKEGLAEYASWYRSEGRPSK